MTRRAFSILELVIALGIILVGMIATARLITPAQRSAVVTKNRQTALAIARNVVSVVQSMPFGASPQVMPTGGVAGVAQLTSLPGLGKLPAPAAPSGEYVEGKAVASEFTVTNVTVTIPGQSAGSATNISCGNVAVTVAWRDVGGNADVSNETKSLTLVGGIFREP